MRISLWHLRLRTTLCSHFFKHVYIFLLFWLDLLVSQRDDIKHELNFFLVFTSDNFFRNFIFPKRWFEWIISHFLLNFILNRILERNEVLVLEASPFVWIYARVFCIQVIIKCHVYVQSIRCSIYIQTHLLYILEIVFHEL